MKQKIDQSIIDHSFNSSLFRSDMTLVVSFSVFVSVFSFEQHRDNTEAADATGEETKENIRSGNEPESKQVDSWIAVVLR